MAERSYPKSEVRGSGLECQVVTVQEWPRGATLCLRSGAAAKRSYPASEVRGGSQEETPRVQGLGRQPRGAILRPRSVAAGKSYPASEVRGGEPEEPPTPEARAGGREEHPNEWWLRRRRRA